MHNKCGGNLVLRGRGVSADIAQKLCLIKTRI